MPIEPRRRGRKEMAFWPTPKPLWFAFCLFAFAGIFRGRNNELPDYSQLYCTVPKKILLRLLGNPQSSSSSFPLSLFHSASPSGRRRSLSFSLPSQLPFSPSRFYINLSILNSVPLPSLLRHSFSLTQSFLLLFSPCSPSPSPIQT